MLHGPIGSWLRAFGRCFEILKACLGWACHLLELSDLIEREFWIISSSSGAADHMIRVAARWAHRCLYSSHLWASLWLVELICSSIHLFIQWAWDCFRIFAYLFLCFRSVHIHPQEVLSGTWLPCRSSSFLWSWLRLLHGQLLIYLIRCLLICFTELLLLLCFSWLRRCRQSSLRSLLLTPPFWSLIDWQHSTSPPLWSLRTSTSISIWSITPHWTSHLRWPSSFQLWRFAQNAIHSSWTLVLLLLGHNHISRCLHHSQPRGPIGYLLLQLLNISFVLNIFGVLDTWLSKVNLLQHLNVFVYLSLLLTFTNWNIQTRFWLVKDWICLQVLNWRSVLSLVFGVAFVYWMHLLLGAVLDVADVNKLVHSVLS